MLRFDSHGNFAGTIFGLILGIVTFVLAIVADIGFRHNTRNVRKLTKGWFLFTAGELTIFLVCNLGKVGTLCGLPSPNSEASTLFPEVADHCGVLTMWFIEWTVMGAFLASVGLWACWSHVGYILQDPEGAYQPGYPVDRNGTQGVSYFPE